MPIEITSKFVALSLSVTAANEKGVIGIRWNGKLISALLNSNYGAGRRICPGMHLAERNMWRIAAKMLWAFEFSEPLDPMTGAVVPLDPHAYNPGILQAPLPFRVRITPRSEAHVAAIKRESAAAIDVLRQYD